MIIYIYIYKQIETDAQNRSCPDRESNHGSPAYRADVLTITPPRPSDVVRQFNIDKPNVIIVT